LQRIVPAFLWQIFSKMLAMLVTVSPDDVLGAALALPTPTLSLTMGGP
jgi:hypothetical protein